MTKLDIIYDQLHNYLMKRGRHPKFIYLGREDIAELKKEGNWYMRDPRKSDEVIGCKLLRVDRDYHIAFSE